MMLKGVVNKQVFINIGGIFTQFYIYILKRVHIFKM